MSDLNNRQRLEQSMGMENMKGEVARGVGYLEFGVGHIQYKIPLRHPSMLLEITSLQLRGQAENVNFRANSTCTVGKPLAMN